MTFTTLPQGRTAAPGNGDGNNIFTTMNGTFPNAKAHEFRATLKTHLQASGAPIRNPASSQRVGGQLRGVSLFQDTNLLELIQSLDRERIPERSVLLPSNSLY